MFSPTYMNLIRLFMTPTIIVGLIEASDHNLWSSITGSRWSLVRTFGVDRAAQSSAFVQ